MMPLRHLVSLTVMLSLAGCAAFDARPGQVISVKTADLMVVPYSPDKAIQALGSIPPNDAAGRNTYRNRVVSAYLTAIDAHYAWFLRDLSRSGKGMHLGFDGALLLLTGAGAIFEKAASDLSAGATAVGGLRSSFDRELFADKALPILISLMDSRRLAVRAEILRGLSQPEGSYTLEEAFSDLTRYEAAGTLDGALSDAATAAGERAKAVNYDYSKAKDLCVVDQATDNKRHDLMDQLETFERNAEATADGKVAASNRASIQKAAQLLGIEAATAPADRDAAFALLKQIRDQIEAQCTVAGVDALRAKLTAPGGVTFQ